MTTNPQLPNPLDCLKLPVNRYGFVIIENEQELLEASSAGHRMVQLTCPGCGMKMIRGVLEAEFIIQYRCAQHTKTDNQ